MTFSIFALRTNLCSCRKPKSPLSLKFVARFPPNWNAELKRFLTKSTANGRVWTRFELLSWNLEAMYRNSMAIISCKKHAYFVIILSVRNNYIKRDMNVTRKKWGYWNWNASHKCVFLGLWLADLYQIWTEYPLTITEQACKKNWLLVDRLEAFFHAWWQELQKWEKLAKIPTVPFLIYNLFFFQVNVIRMTSNFLDILSDVGGVSRSVVMTMRWF